MNSPIHAIESPFDEAKRGMGISNLKPMQLPFTNAKSPVHIPTSSSDIFDTCLANSKPTVRRMMNTENDKLLIDHILEKAGLQFDEPCLGFDYQDYIGKIREFHFKLDTVKSIVRPGCSREVLNVALSSMTLLSGILSAMPSKPKLHASL